MKKQIRTTKRAKQAATSIMKLHIQVAADARRHAILSGKDECWVARGEKQAYRDSLEAMKRAGLIQDYNLWTGEIR